MPKKKKPFIKLACSVCQRINYYTRKSKKTTKKLDLKKYCRYCKKHNIHKETR